MKEEVKEALNVNSITVGIPVSDLESSASWYEKLLNSEEKLIPVDGVIEYSIGSVWIQLFEEKTTVLENILRLEVENLNTEFDRLRNLGMIDDEVIEDVPGIIRYFDFSDPDNNKISLYWLYPQE